MVLVGLGANRGNSRKVILEAMDRLEEFADGELARSSLWRTSPVDCPPGSSDFINAAVAFNARQGLTPESLLDQLKALEREFGRTQPSVRNSPRELDLDLLLYGEQTRATRDFTLPHPRAVDRLFVLAPAAQVLPAAVWPGTKKCIAQLLADLHSDEVVEQLNPDES